MSTLVEPTCRSMRLQARRAGIEMPVARATGFYQTNQPPYFLLLSPDAQRWGRGRERGLCFPFGVWFWCVPDRDDGVMAMFDDPKSGDVTSSSESCDRVTHPTG
jgi:hypothetical protein